MRYDYLLTLFTGNDNFRPQINEPFYQENYAIATDAHACVFVEKSLCKKDYSPNNKKTVDAMSVMASIEPNCNEIVFIEDLLSHSALFDCAYNRTTCTACNGDGYVVCCECSHESECSSCRGTGESLSDLDNMRTKFSATSRSIKLGEAYFAPHLVDKLLNAMLICGVKSCVRTSNYNSKANLFEIEQGVMVVLMPKFQEDEA